MSIINKESKKYVENLFSSINGNRLIENSGTELGNIKSKLLKEKGNGFIQKYDLVINKVIRKELYPDV
jgi:hypothetical protein